MAALSPLANPTATRRVLDEFGLSAKHALGQNFLINDGVIQKIVKLADVTSADSILEIGPGIGTLTAALLQTAGAVTSIEMDPELPAVLTRTTQPWADKFTLIKGDAMSVALSDCGANKLVSNLPYNISTAVTLKYFQELPRLQSATIMVQREVGLRMMAKPGTKDYGAYTVKLNLLARSTGNFAVAHTNFMPAPKVESMVLRLDRHQACTSAGAALTDVQLQSACMWADAAFLARRKTLSNSCKQYFAARGDSGAKILERIDGVFEACGIDARRRGETLTLDEFINLGVETA